ncbi:MAG: polyphosphate kinase 1, partial [Bacteroidota bacterium]
GEGYRFVPIEEVIVHNIGELFRGMEIVSVSAFRVTRNADLDRNESSAEDLLELIAKELRQRRFAAVVRLQVDTRMPGHVRQTLKHELGITDADVYEKRGLLELSDLDALANLGLPDHTYEHWEPVIPKGLVPAVDGDTANLFSIIRKGDVLVHHPYESFQASVARFIDEATADPKVLAIKQTLYRTSNDSPIIYSLIRAAENGKQVAVLVELKARFDEERNIAWAKMLEQAGIHVTYGLVGLKTHTKTALVVREEPDGIAMYSHIGTGNYNSKTAKLYTDIGLLTCNREIGLDLVNLFHHLTGYAPEQQYRKLLVAPRDLRKTFLKRLEREIEHQQKQGNGHLIAVMNGLDDVVTIQALYEASQAGVQIDLVVRGHSRLRPGLPGVSDNIRLVSLIGRFLEHSRIYHFHNNGEPKTYIGSADWMRRNLEDRVEVITPIEDPALQRRVIRILKLALSDNRMGWDLHADGTYVQRQPGSESVRSFQEMLMKEALRTGRVPKAED